MINRQNFRSKILDLEDRCLRLQEDKREYKALITQLQEAIEETTKQRDVVNHELTDFKVSSLAD